MIFTFDQLNQAHDIMSQCEEQIFTQTGMKIRLSISPANLSIITPEEMMAVIAHSLNMKMEHYDKHSKKADRVALRFLASIFLRQYYPKLSMQDIGDLFGGQDHSSISNAIKTGAMYLENGDEKFTSKYYIVRDAVENWIKNYEKADS